MRAVHLPSMLIAAVVLTACGGGTGTGASETAATPATLGLSALAAKPGAKAVVVSLPATTDAVAVWPIQLVAQVTDVSGKPVTGVALTWLSADPSVATVSSTGSLKPLRAGTVNLSASSGKSTAVTVVTVRDLATVRSKYVGMNLAGVGYWSSQFPFANMMKGATRWALKEDSGAWTDPLPTTRADGYPAALGTGQHAVSTIGSAGSGWPAGRYVVLWDGAGSISFPTDIVTVVEAASNRLAIDVKSSPNTLWVSIDATSQANPLRNLRFLWPGTELTYSSEPFTKEFLGKTRPFSVLRFMDWGQTNNSPVVNWSDQPLVSDSTYQTSKGVPIQVMIDLANKLHADPWFCIPHQASDAYVREFATLLHSALDPTLKPHIEYSNEVWNTGFAQTNWAIAESNRLGLAVPYGQPSLFYAKRSFEIFKIMQDVYGTTDKGRLVRVMAGQAAWTQFLESALAYSDTAANADVMAIAPYFRAEAAADVANVNTTLTLSSDQIVDQMFANVRGTVKSWIVANASLASRYGLKMKGYEGGSGNTANYFPAAKVDAMKQLLIAANRNPRMRDLYLEYYGLWTANGGEAFNQYNDIGIWKPWGMWGALESTIQDPVTSPKYRGLVEFAAAHP